MTCALGIRLAAAGIGLGMAAMLPAQAARAPTLQILQAVERGSWELHEVGNPRGSRLCLADVAEALQLRHRRGAGCSRFVIDNQPRAATVHYTCPGAGHGRTVLNAETPRLVRVETQGVANNQPFDVAYEARRVRACRATR